MLLRGCDAAQPDASCAWRQAVSSLAAQRSLFTDISAKLGTVDAKFPVVNSLVTAIRRKKSKARARRRCARAEMSVRLPVIARACVSDADATCTAQDTIILSAVVAGCTLFLLVYWSSK